MTDNPDPQGATDGQPQQPQVQMRVHLDPVLKLEPDLEA